MIDKVEYLEIDGKKYPIFCDFNVLEEIQNKYEEIDNFDKILTGRKDDDTTGEINISALKYILMLMLNEGSEIDGKATNYTETEVGRLIGYFGLHNAFLKVREQILYCLNGKNAQTTHNQKETVKKIK